jgi:hypothetical protein
MSRESSWLLEYQKNVYSQSGEDGIIDKVLEVLPTNDKWCVEFGAWDGLFLCNARNLIESHGYSSVLIEASKQKFLDLQKNFQHRKGIHLVNQFVGFRENDNLDTILKNTPIPKNFDFLSIDIDGNDYHVWKMVNEYRPKVVCIEFNPTIATGIEFIQEADPETTHGCSVSSLVKLGKEKGYELVCIVHCNAIFVDAPYYPAFEIADNHIEALRLNLDTITNLFVGYDGKIFLTGKQKLPWHNVAIKPSDIKILPSFLQKYPGNYSFFEKVVFAAYLLFRDPQYLIELLRKSKKSS